MPVNARDSTGTSRDKAGTSRDKAGTNRDNQGHYLSVPVCPFMFLSVPVCPCLFLLVLVSLGELFAAQKNLCKS